MARAKHKQKASFAGIPRVVMDCPDYINLNGSAVKLLIELACQFKGGNNGDLCPAWTLIKVRGFCSKTTPLEVNAPLMPTEIRLVAYTGEA